MRLYTKKKFHAKSPVAARITYSVRGYENTRGVAEGTRVFFRRARSPRRVASPSPPRPFYELHLRFLRQIRSCLHEQFLSGSLFIRREPNVNRAASTVSPIGGSRRNRKHIRSLFTRDFSPVSALDSGCLIRTRSNFELAVVQRKRI